MNVCELYVGLIICCVFFDFEIDFNYYLFINFIIISIKKIDFMREN